jgi:hypothetical protein
MTRPTDPGQASEPLEHEPEIIETDPDDRRATLPPNFDPDGLNDLQKLLNLKSKKGLEKVDIDTIWSAIGQARIAIVEWKLVATDLEKQIDELQNESIKNQGVIQFLSDRLGGSSGASRPALSAKHPDPAPLNDNTTVKYEHWKLELEGKFKRNADHFATEDDRKIYVYSCTEGEAREHLTPRYTDGDFDTAQDMIVYLATIYVDRYKVQNARYDYRRLVMKGNQPFPEFYTKFSQLASTAKIPEDDLRPDLYDKLSFDLQKLILPTYGSLTSLTLLRDQCLLLDQENRRLQERMNRNQARKVVPQTSGNFQNLPAPNPPRPTTSIPTLAAPPVAPAPGFTPRIRPQYDDPVRKALSLAGKCFKCRQIGHFSRDCPVKNEINITEEADDISGSGKDSP